MLSSWNFLSPFLALHCAERSFSFRSIHFQIDSTNSLFIFTALMEPQLRFEYGRVSTNNINLKKERLCFQNTLYILSVFEGFM